MTDDVKQSAPPDRSVINMTEDWEVQWWCQRWGITAAQLKAAVADVGAKTDAVAAHLGKEP